MTNISLNVGLRKGVIKTTWWITRGIAKSSKCKQKLYEKFFKNQTSENEMSYKNYRKLFESLKRKTRKIIFTPNN